MTTDMPNVVLAVMDTARVDRFGCYGYERPTTPTVDALAGEGMLAESMISNAPWTLPSHASLFSSLYPSQHGSQWQTGPQLRESVTVTMAEWFRSIGYDTICATNNGLISDRTKLARGFDKYAFRLDLEQGRRRVARRIKKVLFGGDSGGLIINDWINQTVQGGTKPKFLFVNYLECHWAYVPPRKFEKRVGGPRFGFVEGAKYRGGVARSSGPWEAIARADERTLDIYSTLYDGELANADDHVKDLVEIIENAGMTAENTLLLVTSDHGEHLGEFGLADHHASLDDLLIHVPFVARGPGITPGHRKDGIYELVDVWPSLCRALGRDVPVEEMRARRSDLLTSESLDTSTDNGYAFSEWRSWSEKERTRLAQRNPSFDFSGLGVDLVSARDERFKLVRMTGIKDQLFDLDTDPEEKVDVAALWPREMQRLQTALDQRAEEWMSWEERESTPLSGEDEAEIEKRLAALGYI